MIKRFRRRLLANFYFLQKPTFEFLPLLLFLVFLLFVGSYCFHHLYEQEELSYPQALFITYCLIFMEHLIPFPKHWVLQLFYFLLPPLGLVVILDGFVRYGYHVLRSDVHSPHWVQSMAKTYNGHVILCGLGRVGFRVLEKLLELGEDVVVLEKDQNNTNLAFARNHQIPLIIGSGREEGILSRLNAENAKSIILATDDDLANLELALDARKLCPDIRVVMRMFDQELASKIRESFNINSAFSTAQLAAPLFATSSSDRSIVNSFYVGDKLLVVANLTVNEGSQLIGKQIKNVGAEHEIFILAHTRNEIAKHFPPGETDFQVGDQLTIQTQPESLKKLHKWNKDQPPY